MKDAPVLAALQRIETQLSGTVPRQPTVPGYLYDIALPLTQPDAQLIVRAVTHADGIVLTLTRDAGHVIWTGRIAYRGPL